MTPITFFRFALICLALLVFLRELEAFISTPRTSAQCRLPLSLFMGRAAAVRAATKAKTDAAKAKNNNRYAKKIIQAVKAGGPDPVINRMLATVIQEAKTSNVPNDVIDRNIKKASDANTANYKESLFEFYGHGGVGIIVNVLTDNDNRAASDVALVAKKNALKPATGGSVIFNFDKKARLDVSSPAPADKKVAAAPSLTEDSVMELCLESGVDDYDFRGTADGSQFNPADEGSSVVYVSMSDLSNMRDALAKAGYKVEASLRNLPKEGCVAVADDVFDLNMKAFDAFEELDDVDLVEHNMDLTGE